MRKILVLSFSFLAIILHSQDMTSCLSESILVIGNYNRAECGLVTDSTRDITDDNKSAEAVMDKTGITELGTGFVYESDHKKYIITCEHVLYKSERIVAFDKEFKEYELELVGSDMPFDLAVLQFKDQKEASYFKGLTFANSSTLNKDAKVEHIGFWTIDGEANYKTANVLSTESGRAQSLPLTEMGYFESKIYVPGGFSGGPVIDTTGNVIGMSTARNSQGTSYSLKSKIIKRLVEDIIKYGKVRRIFTGIKFGQEVNNGAVTVNGIIKNTPAYRRYKDLIHKEIVSINSHPVKSIFDALLIMEEIKPDMTITFGLKTGSDVIFKSELLDYTNLVKIVYDCLSIYCDPQFINIEENNDIVVFTDKEKTQIIKTAGLSGNKVYCLTNLAQLGVIIRLFSLQGSIEFGTDDSHIYINEIKLSDNKMRRILYY